MYCSSSHFAGGTTFFCVAPAHFISRMYTNTRTLTMLECGEVFQRGLSVIVVGSFILLPHFARPPPPPKARSQRKWPLGLTFAVATASDLFFGCRSDRPIRQIATQQQQRQRRFWFICILANTNKKQQQRNIIKQVRQASKTDTQNQTHKPTNKNTKQRNQTRNGSFHLLKAEKKGDVLLFPEVVIIIIIHL